MKSTLIPYALLLLCVGINAKTCFEQVQELETSPLLGAFKPICNHDGTYAELQSHEGYYFCVFPITGEEILGTRIRGEKPKSCKATLCLIQRHEGIFNTNRGLVGYFKPECEADGSFKKKQCHGSTGYCYCVVPESGETIFGTEVRGEPTNCEKAGLNIAKKCFDDLKSLQENPLLGAFKPVCQPNGLYEEIQSHEGYYFCVVPLTGEEILGTRIKGAKPKFCKATPCFMQRHQALLNSKKGMVGHSNPKCNEDGSFEKMQCHGSTGLCFCVNTESGIKFEGTEIRGTPDCEKAGLKIAKKCLAEVNSLLTQPLPGAFKPVCQPNGLYQETQCHEGYCYCVFPETGDEILGTRVRFNKPKSCKATTCFTKRHYAIHDSKSGMVGHFTPQCDENGAFVITQCHSSTGYCFCVMPQSGEKVLGTEIQFKKPKSCGLTDCVYQRHLALKSHLLGVFKPVCDENGAYTPTQCHEGACYCVFPENGQEILGSRLPVGQKPESCEMTSCMQKRHDVLSSVVPLFGAFKPECTSDGKYNPTQCHEGVCYCVFPDSGEEILGTMTRFYKPKTCSLTPCILERHKGWARTETGFLGVPISRCDENGMYAKVQCRRDLCWCVDPKTGKAIKEKAPQFTVPDC